MAGRFPFDSGHEANQQQFNAAAQMRAALGLPPLQSAASIDTNETALFLQAQAAQVQRQQSEQIQHDFHLRQALIQEQIDRHISLERLRGLSTPFLAENPDLRDFKRELEIRQFEEQRQLGEHQQDFLRQQVSQLRYQDEMRRQHQLQHQQQQQQQQQQPAFQNMQDEALLAAQRRAHQTISQAQVQTQAAQLQREVEDRAQTQNSVQEHLQSQLDTLTAIKEQTSLETAVMSELEVPHDAPSDSPLAYSAAPRTPTNFKSLISPCKNAKGENPNGNQTPFAGKDSVLSPPQHLSVDQEASVNSASETQQVTQVDKSTFHPDSIHSILGSNQSLTLEPTIKKRVPKRRVIADLKPHHRRSKDNIARVRKNVSKSIVDGHKQLRRNSSSDSRNALYNIPQSPLETVAIAADIASPWMDKARKGTFIGLLKSAAEAAEMEKTDEAVSALSGLKSVCNDVLYSDKEDEEEDQQFVFVAQPTIVAEAFECGRFKSELPSLPIEPEANMNIITYEYPEDIDTVQGSISNYSSLRLKSTSTSRPETVRWESSLLTDYPVATDSWWPSTEKIRSERRKAGESSDEEDFDETLLSSDETTVFRANEKKIRRRLSSMDNPGFLEKLNHCRIHRSRARNKKSNSTLELVYCCQVTDIYPNDIMVCCSICGTWRHAACGGHYKPYSTRENCHESFVAVCENCHEEQKLLNDFPRAQQRLKRQQIEQLRRALSTSAVMRKSSYSKHSGTYKWPIGSVSSTHIGGHTRSVQARHDKSERQWTELVTRASDAAVGRSKHTNLRARTKDLEHLLFAIEDAESYTDRHNMMNFLIRDTCRESPIGYSRKMKNYFDPEEHFDTPNLNGALDGSRELSPEKAGLNHGMTNGRVSESFDAREEPSLLLPLCKKSADTDSQGEPRRSDDQESQSESHLICICARKGCTKSARFDSCYCSDACGISTLETDLLRSFQDASELHPTVVFCA